MTELFRHGWARRLSLAALAVTVIAGGHSATAYGCDLTKGYIDENAAYYSS